MTALFAARRGAVERAAVGEEWGGMAGTGKGVAWVQDGSISARLTIVEANVEQKMCQKLP
eukprot:148205-Pelagomonas_calceolata.AAC.1